MKDEKTMNKMPSAQEQSDESLDTVAGGAGSWTPSFLFNPVIR